MNAKVSPYRRLHLLFAVLVAVSFIWSSLSISQAYASSVEKISPNSGSSAAGAKTDNAGCSVPGGGTIPSPYCDSYSGTDLGSVPGLPPLYGGLTFLDGDPNTILIGGNANTQDGDLYAVSVVRDGDNHITGFSGTATFYAEAAYNDGGVVYGPDGILFLGRWPVNELGQTVPGSTQTDKIIDLEPYGVVNSLSALRFVPVGYPGAGQMKLVSYPGGEWYTASYAPDGTGTYTITEVVSETQIVGGPEGIIYVPPGSPHFADYDSMIISEYGSGNVAAYELDDNGDPIPSTRTVFIENLTGAEGAAIDPLTGDFLFSTFGGNNRVVRVTGFGQPPTAVTLSHLEAGIASQPMLPVISFVSLAGVLFAVAIHRRKSS